MCFTELMTRKRGLETGKQSLEEFYVINVGYIVYYYVYNKIWCKSIFSSEYLFTVLLYILPFVAFYGYTSLKVSLCQIETFKCRRWVAKVDSGLFRFCYGSGAEPRWGRLFPQSNSASWKRPCRSDAVTEFFVSVPDGQLPLSWRLCAGNGASLTTAEPD